MVKKLVPVSALSNNSLRQRPSMINEAREVLCQVFKFGLLAGKQSGSTFPDSISSRKDSQNFVSRSCSK